MIAVCVQIDVGIKSPFQRRKPKNTILLKKQVKFTDDVNATDAVQTPVSEEEEPKAITKNEPSQGWLSLE